MGTFCPFLFQVYNLFIKNKILILILFSRFFILNLLLHAYWKFRGIGVIYRMRNLANFDFSENFENCFLHFFPLLSYFFLIFHFFSKYIVFNFHFFSKFSFLFNVFNFCFSKFSFSSFLFSFYKILIFYKIFIFFNFSFYFENFSIFLTLFYFAKFSFVFNFYF